MKTLKMFIIVMVPLFLLSCTNQQTRNKGDAKDAEKKAVLLENEKVEGDNSDKNFVKDAATGGLMEVELGRYAEQNAVNPRVKNYGAMMVRDHTKANEELRSIASAKSINIPTAPDDSELNKINDLKKKTGAEFDREYIKEMVDDHEKDVDKFRKYAENGNDAELKAFAAKTLPVLLTHQDSAKRIRDAVDK